LRKKMGRRGWDGRQFIIRALWTLRSDQWRNASASAPAAMGVSRPLKPGFPIWTSFPYLSCR
jgi:hypothetical protein